MAGLSIKQIRAAAALARGATDTAAIEAAGVARSTFYKWVKQKQFKDAVRLFTKQENENRAALAAAGGSDDDIAVAYQDEVWIKEQTRDILELQVSLVLGLLERIEPEDVSTRQLPQYIQAITQLVESLRTSNDRISGIEEILHELSKIEAARAKNVVSISDAGQRPAV